jgi:natural product precursor
MQKLKLNRLSDRQLAEKQMNSILGGAGQNDCPKGCCGCPNNNSVPNFNANMARGLYTEGCIALPEVVIK